MKKILMLMLIGVFGLLMQSCFPPYPSLPTPSIPERMMETNDEYDVIWSLPNIYMDTCDQRSLMANAPGIIFVEKLESLQTIDSLNGNTVWQREPSSGWSGIILAHAKILYHANGGVAAVEAYNTADGALLWETKLTGGRSADTLYYAENKIFVSTNNDEFFVLNDQGEIIEHRSPVSTIYIEINGIKYLQNTALRAFDSALEHELWQVERDPYDPFRSPPIFDAGTIFLRTEMFNGSIYSIDQLTGKVKWKVSQKMYSNLYVAGEKIYFIGSDGYLVAIDRNSGAELSKAKFSIPFDVHDPTEAYCITGDPTNHVLVLSFGDSRQLLGLRIKNP